MAHARSEPPAKGHVFVGAVCVCACACTYVRSIPKCMNDHHELSLRSWNCFVDLHSGIGCILHASFSHLGSDTS